MVNLVFVGCEYTGKSTIASLVEPWYAPLCTSPPPSHPAHLRPAMGRAEATFGTTSHFHDHFTVPSSELLPDAQQELVE